MNKPLADERGYSLVEVLVAIVILVVAVIPMVKMFDVGLKTSTLSNNYDKARSLANKQVEIARNLPYEDATQPADFERFPCIGSNSGCQPNCASFDENGVSECSSLVDDSDDVYANFTFDVVKRYVDVEPPENSTDTELEIVNTNNDDDSGIVRLTITVKWSGGSYTTTGLVTK